jgi:hypothetical protein
MKKITLLLTLFFATVVMAQQQTYTLDFEAGSVEADNSVWETFDPPSPTFEFAANPDQTGVNTSAQAMKVTVPQNGVIYAGINNSGPGINAFGTWVFDPNIQSNLTVTMDVYKSTTTPVGLQMVNNTNGDVFTIHPGSAAAALTPTINAANVWQTLTFDITSELMRTGSNNNVINRIAIFLDWSNTRSGNVEVYVDNITWTATKLSDAPMPSCTDGIQNGDETGVDCGGATCAPCDALPPVAPQFGSTGTDLFVYSDLGDASNSVSNFQLNLFGNGTRGAVDLDSDGTDETFKLDGVAFYGAEWTAVDLTALPYQFVHLDYYATTTTEFKFFLIDQSAGINGGNPEEPRFTVNAAGGDATITNGQWTSLFIPLSVFENFPTPSFNYDLTDIFQYKFETSGGVMYFDNVYFSTTDTLTEDSFDLSSISISPNPSSSLWAINGAQENIIEVVVYDMLGKEVLNMQPNTARATIDGTNLVSGLYLTRVITNSGTKTFKLIKN